MPPPPPPSRQKHCRSQHLRHRRLPITILRRIPRLSVRRLSATIPLRRRILRRLRPIHRRPIRRSTRRRSAAIHLAIPSLPRRRRGRRWWWRQITRLRRRRISIRRIRGRRRIALRRRIARTRRYHLRRSRKRRGRYILPRRRRRTRQCRLTLIGLFRCLVHPLHLIRGASSAARTSPSPYP